MKNITPKTIATFDPPLRNSMNPATAAPPTVAGVLIALVLACIALLPRVQAVVPAPDGGYPGGNTAEGTDALLSLTSGTNNTAVGWFSLNTLTTGQYNTAVGAGALSVNTANLNTATGAAALWSNTSGRENTAKGALALFSNITGSENTANGAFALFGNTAGFFNVANGHSALYSNATGSFNTANGNVALYSNTDGNGNTANGNSTLYSNITGDNNTANGLRALLHNTTGSINTANGVNALQSNTIGGANTAIGYQALFNNAAGNFNTALGYFAGSSVTGDNNIDIGNTGLAADSETIRIGIQGLHGATYIAGIRGATVASGVTVVAGTGGHLGTMTSSRRFKEEIKPMDKASEAVLALKPVTFRYKRELDPNGIPQFGLVAEEVEKVNPNLVACDAKGEVFTVRYEAVNAMLLNEFLKEHQKVKEQQSSIARLQATVAQQQHEFRAAIAQQRKKMETIVTHLREQAAQIQKVNDQLQVSKPAPQLVVSKP
jgi:trimeric autotransporter adhesin